MKVLGYGPNNVPITQEDLDFSKELIAEYEAKEQTFLARAKFADKAQRGALRANATKARRNAESMKKNLAAQKSWVGNP